MLNILFTIFALGFIPNIVPAQDESKLSVYYESLCPDSASFFSQQLGPVYRKLRDNLVVEIIPYGNAHYSGQPDAYRFRCQHGPDECYGNMVQACYITLVNNTADQIDFINCAFAVRNQRKIMEKCIQNVDLRRQVKKCVTSPMGNNLLYQMAKKTDALNPPHTFIPWITINDRGNEDLNDKANQNLLKTLCDEAFSREKPEECKKIKQDILKQFRNNYL